MERSMTVLCEYFAFLSHVQEIKEVKVVKEVKEGECIKYEPSYFIYRKTHLFGSFECYISNKLKNILCSISI